MKHKSITGLHIRERLQRMSKKKEVQKMAVVNEMLLGSFEMSDANGQLLVAKPKAFNPREADLWVDNIRHAVSMLRGDVRMQGWVLGPECKEQPRGKATLESGVDKDIVIHAVAQNLPKKKKELFARRSTSAERETKWFCSLRGKVLKFFEDEQCEVGGWAGALLLLTVCLSRHHALRKRATFWGRIPVERFGGQ